jgi:hypothetical protein
MRHALVSVLAAQPHDLSEREELLLGRGKVECGGKAGNTLAVAPGHGDFGGLYGAHRCQRGDRDGRGGVLAQAQADRIARKDEAEDLAAAILELAHAAAPAGQDEMRRAQRPAFDDQPRIGVVAVAGPVLDQAQYVALMISKWREVAEAARQDVGGDKSGTCGRSHLSKPVGALTVS